MFGISFLESMPSNTLNDAWASPRILEAERAML